MSLTEIQGDLFAVPGLDALAHGVNCTGVMGAGIALQFKRRWPAMFRAYGDYQPTAPLLLKEMLAAEGVGL